LNDETTRLVIAAAVLLNVTVIGTAIVALFVRRVQRRKGMLTAAGSIRLSSEATAQEGMALADWLPATESTAREPRYERVFRIASWTFLLLSAAIVALSGMWAARLPQIVTLVAATGGCLLLIHDVLPSGAPRPVRAAVQAIVTLAFASLLVGLTNGFDSPFFFTFALIVGAASLVVPSAVAIALAAVGAAGYLGAASVASGAPTSFQVVTAAVNLIGLFLLTYIASAVGREHHLARHAALRLSALDSLTGLYNRPFLFAAVAREIARSERTGRGFCLLMLDLDDLKEINAQRGHHVGDSVLRAVGETLRGSIRRIDVAARYGGDEFMALLPETDPTGGWVTAEKVRLAMRGRPIPGLADRPTVSLGVVSYPIDGRSADTLMLSADRAMYVAKRGGKDRVATASSEDAVIPIGSARTPQGGDQAG